MTFDGARANFNSGAKFGFNLTTPVIGARLADFWVPRRSDYDFFCFLDWLDELCYADKQATCTVTPAVDSGSLVNTFRDNSDCAIWSSGTSPSPIVIEMDFSANPILHKNAAAWNLGLTLRYSSYCSHIKIEAASSSLVYSTMYDGDVSFDTGGVWLSPIWNPVSPYHIYKLKVTLTVTTPLPADFRIQRLMLYHQAGNWDPWHLHVGGGTMYGNVMLAGAALQSVAGEDLTLTPASGKNVKLSGLKFPNADGTAGYVMKTDGAANLGWVANVPAPPTSAGDYKLHIDAGGVATWVVI